MVLKNFILEIHYKNWDLHGGHCSKMPWNHTYHGVDDYLGNAESLAAFAYLTWQGCVFLLFHLLSYMSFVSPFKLCFKRFYLYPVMFYGGLYWVKPMIMNDFFFFFWECQWMTPVWPDDWADVIQQKKKGEK